MIKRFLGLLIIPRYICGLKLVRGLYYLNSGLSYRSALIRLLKLIKFRTKPSQFPYNIFKKAVKVTFYAYFIVIISLKNI